MIDTCILKDLFDYSPQGGLIRKKSLTNSKAGVLIGFGTKNGYRCAMVNHKTYPLHRLVWMWHGNAATNALDHINGDPSDNRIENLRIATRSQNMCNRKTPTHNTTGAKGVIWKKDKRLWCVRIGVCGVRKQIGYFEDLELAELVAIEARNKYHGAFANHL